MPKNNNASALKQPANSTVAFFQDRSSNRISGKAASDALKQGNNAGMLFKKEVKSATTVKEHLMALQKLRLAELGSKGDSLRQWSS